MKKIWFYVPLFMVVITITLLILMGCSFGNKAQGEPTKKEKIGFHNKPIPLRGLDGTIYGSVNAFKTKFDGHTWYVFCGGNYGSTAVVHDPLCQHPGYKTNINQL